MPCKLHLPTGLPHKAADWMLGAFCCVSSEPGPGTLHIFGAAFVMKVSKQLGCESRDVTAEVAGGEVGRWPCRKISDSLQSPLHCCREQEDCSPSSLHWPRILPPLGSPHQAVKILPLRQKRSPCLPLHLQSIRKSPVALWLRCIFPPKYSFPNASFAASDSTWSH